jgi:hypothetical protein
MLISGIRLLRAARLQDRQNAQRILCAVATSFYQSRCCACCLHAGRPTQFGSGPCASDGAWDLASTFTLLLSNYVVCWGDLPYDLCGAACTLAIRTQFEWGGKTYCKSARSGYVSILWVLGAQLGQRKHPPCWYIHRSGTFAMHDMRSMDTWRLKFIETGVLLQIRLAHILEQVLENCV